MPTTTDVNSHYLSYSHMITDRGKFKSIYKNEDHQPFDAPGNFYFKILFYFNNQQNEDGMESNLLGKENGNTALSYLKKNAETERAAMLEEFIYLLSEISANSPWYFQSIEGMESTQNRSYLKEFKADEPRQLTIKCLQDPIDSRITNLLELYRASCFSHIWRKEIVPANLRKFDMGIYIFQAPINGNKYSNVDKKIPNQGIVKRSEANDIDAASCKYLEFHNCEISLDSLNSCYGTPDNSKGFAIEPSIIINYDDCFTSNYNEFTCRTIGDFVQVDINRQITITNIDTSKSDDNSSNEKFITKFIDKTLTNLKGKAYTKAQNLINSAFLGNVYGLSLSNIMQSVNDVANGGDIFAATGNLARQGKNIITKGKNVVEDMKGEIARQNDKTLNTSKNLGSVFDIEGYKPKSNKERLGNVAKKMIRDL